MKRLAPLLLASCATLADGAPGLDNAPSARAGPFRLLVVGELGQSRVPPNAMDDNKNRLKDVSVIDADGDPSTLAIEGYFAASEEDADPDAPSTRIVRIDAADGRSFDRPLELDVVLHVDDLPAWAGDRLGAPSVLVDADGNRRIYFETDGGIGLAIEEGGGFAIPPEPVLAPGDVPWATASLRSPGAIQLEDGTHRLYYETEEDGAPVIGVAYSADGVVFEDRGVVIERGASENDVDGDDLGSPCPVLAVSAEGRDVLFVYYTARSKVDKQVISLAARFLDEGDEELSKSNAAMYGPSGGVEPREPAVVRFEEFTLLFSTQKPARDSTDVVITVGVSPGNIELPAPI